MANIYIFHGQNIFEIYVANREAQLNIFLKYEIYFNLHISKYIYKCISGARIGVSPPEDLHSRI